MQKQKKLEFSCLSGDFLPLTSALDERELLISGSGCFASGKMASCTSCVLDGLFGFNPLALELEIYSLAHHLCSM